MDHGQLSMVVDKFQWVFSASRLNACGKDVMQDGSSFALHDGVREVCPGRFTVVKPAAVALHTTMDLLCDAPTTVVLTPDTTAAQAFLPEPASLRASVLLADRGSVDVH